MQLALDTSTTWSSIAIVDGSDVLGVRELAGVNPGEIVVATIDELLRESGVERSQLRQINVGVGPGPYTSTRVGVAIARTLGFALAIEVVGVCSHDAIAAEVVATSSRSEHFVVATDARRSEIYWAKYSAAGRRISGPGVGKPATVARGNADTSGWFGNGLDRHPMVVEEFGLEVAEPSHPGARWIAAVARDALAVGGTVPASQPLLADHAAGSATSLDGSAVLFAPYPLYLRRPDAVPSAKVVAP